MKLNLFMINPNMKKISKLLWKPLPLRDGTQNDEKLLRQRHTSMD